MKQNQVIAIEKGAKATAERAITDSYHRLQKHDLLIGLARSYEPIDEDGESYPSEQKLVQVKLTEELVKLIGPMGKFYDIVATKVRTNTKARADVVVDGETLVAGAPVELLLFLEKQLVNLHTLIAKLPVLDPAEEWTWDGNRGCQVTQPKKQIRTKKVRRNHVMAPATKEHAAQVEVYTEDIQVGTWTVTKMSGAMPADDRIAMLGRVEALQIAVKQAREQANMEEAAYEEGFGERVLRFLFGE
jgi:hypothetical protein